MRFRLIVGMVVVAMLGCVLEAQVIRGGVAGGVSLPYSVADNNGNQWMIYQGGFLRQSGNMPLFSQAAMLTINGSSVSSAGNQVRLDEKSGELIIDGVTSAGVGISRRILINRQDSYVRYIDVFKNSSPQDMAVNVQLNTNFNYGMQSALTLTDPRKKDRTIGYAVALEAGRAIFELYALKGAKTFPLLNIPQQGTNLVQTRVLVPIPARKQAALLHIHGISASVDAASQAATSFRESQLLAGVPADIRKIIVNIGASQTVGDQEILRGDMFDVLELRGGDQLKGTIVEKTYKLDTFYGAIELPADRIVALINVGQFRPRQLLVTADGEVFGGLLSTQTIGMQLSSGQTTQVPLSQISRFGYRKRPGEPEEWTFDRPMISLRSGDRMLVALPTGPIDVMTRYGLLKLRPDTVSAISFQSEEHGVHDIQLTDGSKFAGLVSGDHFDLQLVGTASQQKVTFPAATVARLQFTRPTDDGSGEDESTLDLVNQDQFVGNLTGQLKLDTNFDAITINAQELRSLTHAPDGGLDVQIILWDQTTLGGQLREPQVACNLKCGVTVNVPVPLIARYANPQPLPSQTMVDRIKAVVVQLSAEDWKQREQAEAQLVSMGPMIAGVLKELGSSQPPEAQQRIESVLKQFEKKPQPAAGFAPAN